jgi:hypothetical protein
LALLGGQFQRFTPAGLHRGIGAEVTLTSFTGQSYLFLTLAETLLLVLGM